MAFAKEKHRYILWRDLIAESEEGVFTVDAIVTSMRIHGTLETNPTQVKLVQPGLSNAEDRMREIIKHNTVELNRALEESGKWEARLHASPLGKTQQDVAAYYSEVIDLFNEWFAARGIPIS